MEVRLEIEDPYLARTAWLSAVLAVPAWSGKDGQPSIRTVPLYARLLAEAVASSWPHEETEELPMWDALLEMAANMAAAAGAPSRPKVGYHAGPFYAITHETRNDLGSTKVELSFPEAHSGLPFVLLVSGPRVEAVARRMHAAALHVETALKVMGKSVTLHVRGEGEPEPEPEVVKRYPDEEE